MKSRKWQFGLWAILFMMACIAGFLAGYRYGGDVKDQQVAASSITVVNYDVREFLDSKRPESVDAQLSEIRDLVVETIEPDSWQMNDRDIVPYPNNGSIVIRQSGSCHEEIRELLEQLRRLKNRK